MPLTINSLADLKRALALPGVVVKLVDLDAPSRARWNPEKLAKNIAGRTVMKVRSADFILEGGSHMNFGKVTEWTFYGSDTVTWNSPDAPAGSHFLTYQIVPAASATEANNTPKPLLKVLQRIRDAGYDEATIDYDAQGNAGIMVPDRGRYMIVAEGDRGYYWRNEAGKLSDGFVCDLYLSDGEEIADCLLHLIEE